MSEHERTQLGAYALGALEPHEARELDEHLATCPECRAELAELEEMKQFLGEVPPEAFLDGPPEDGDLLTGVLIGRQTVGEPDEPTAGYKQVTATDSSTGTTMATTVEPRTGWSWIQVQITGLKAGAQCVMLVTDKTGKTWEAGSWVVSEKAAHDGSRFGGGVLVPIDQVKSVEIRTVQGQHVVTTTI